MKYDELKHIDDPDRLRQIALSLLERNLLLEHLNSQLKEAIRLGRRLQFGRKAESFNALQQQLFAEDIQTDIADLQARVERHAPIDPPPPSSQA